MSDLTNLENRRFERLLGMAGGYVLDFSNRTFAEFITDRNIFDSRTTKAAGRRRIGYARFGRRKKTA